MKKENDVVPAVMPDSHHLEKKNDVVPPEMPEAYHKARRQLCLFSAILIFWEYVGIRFGEKAAEPVIVKLPAADTKVRLENPEVIPVVIVLLVLYFSFRLTVEWKQSDIIRRAEKASRVDLFASYLLAVVSLVLFLFQQLFAFRLADFLTPIAFLFLSFGFITPFTASNFLRATIFSSIRRKMFFYLGVSGIKMKIFVHLIMLLFLSVIIFFSLFWTWDIKPAEEFALIPYFIGAAISYLILWSYSRFKKYLFIRSGKAQGIPMEDILFAWDSRKKGPPV